MTSRVGIADPDPPGIPVRVETVGLDVAAGIDEVVGEPARGEQIGGALDRPALYQPGWVDSIVAGDVEIAVAEEAGLLA